MTATSSSRAATVVNSGTVPMQASGNVPCPCASSVKTCSIPRAAASARTISNALGSQSINRGSASSRKYSISA